MKYKVGDFVKIKNNANEIDSCIVNWVYYMNVYLGKTMRISSLSTDGCAKLENAISGDYRWLFDVKWFEPTTINILKRHLMV